MKKVLIAVLVLGFIGFLAPAPAKAYSLAELQAMINQLQAQLAAQQQTDGPNKPVYMGPNNKPIAITPCAYLTRDLKYGSDASKDEVVILQKFLRDQGHVKHEITAVFDSATLQTVKNFQAANGIEATGYVGPMTRAKINSLICTKTDPNVGRPSITVDVDGDTFLTVMYNNLPKSKIVLVSAESGEQFDVDDNVYGSGDAQFEERNKRPGKYYLMVVSNESGKEVAQSNSFYLGGKADNSKNSIVLYTPNGNTYKPQENIVVTWSENYDTSDDVVITIMDSNTGTQYYSGPIGRQFVGKSATTLSAEASNIPAGQYILTFCDNGTPNPAVPGKPLCAHARFSIAGKNTNPGNSNYSLVLQTPKSDVTWTVGKPYEIKWKSRGNVGVKGVHLYDINTYAPVYSLGEAKGNSMKYTVSPDVAPGTYMLAVCGYNYCPAIGGSSSARITITKDGRTTPPVVVPPIYTPTSIPVSIYSLNGERVALAKERREGKGVVEFVKETNTVPVAYFWGTHATNGNSCKITSTNLTTGQSVVTSSGLGSGGVAYVGLADGGVGDYYMVKATCGRGTGQGEKASEDFAYLRVI